MPPENQSGLIETYLAALALLQSPLISSRTRFALTRLMVTLSEDIKALRTQPAEDKTRAQGAGDDAA